MTPAAGVAVTPMTGDKVTDLVQGCLANQPGGRDGADPTPTRWCIAELTDGRLTGVETVRGWLLSCDDFPQDCPSRLNVDGSDWWRLHTLRVFDAAGEIRVINPDHADDVPDLRGWQRTDAFGVDVDLRPRDRHLLLDTTGALTYGPSGLFTRNRHGHGRRGGFITILPVPATRPGRSPETGTWLSIREYFSADEATGSVGVTDHRYVGFSSGPRPRRTS